MKRLLVALVLLVFASSVGAAELGKRGKKEYMGACGVSDAGLIYVITNGSIAASCDAAQAAGALRIYCSCTPDGVGGYAWGLLDTALGEVDLSAYALLAGAAFTGTVSVGNMAISEESGEVTQTTFNLGLNGLAFSSVGGLSFGLSSGFFAVTGASSIQFDAVGGGGFFIQDLTGVTLGHGGSGVIQVTSSSIISYVPQTVFSGATLPACDATVAPGGTTALAWDTTGPDLCACPGGVDWIPVDGTGTCV